MLGQEIEKKRKESRNNFESEVRQKEEETRERMDRANGAPEDNDAATTAVPSRAIQTPF